MKEVQSVLLVLLARLVWRWLVMWSTLLVLLVLLVRRWLQEVRSAAGNCR